MCQVQLSGGNKVPASEGALEMSDCSMARCGTGPIDHLLPRAILEMGQASRACSEVHKVVHAFRQAHMISPEEANVQSARIKEIFSQYDPSLIEETERSAVLALSQPAIYQALRVGGRARPFYPPLGEEALSRLCDEIRAALTWAVVEAGERGSRYAPQ